MLSEVEDTVPCLWTLNAQDRTLNIEKKGEERREGKLWRGIALLGRHCLCEVGVWVLGRGGNWMGWSGENGG